MSATAMAAEAVSGVADDPRLRYVLRLADTSLILVHRLAEWVCHSPALEEDIGLANISSRVDLMNGKVNFDSSAGRGTTVQIEIPLKNIE